MNEKLVDQAKSGFAGMNDVQRKIAIAAVVIIALMIVFPPMAIAITNLVLGMAQTQHYGYAFLLSNPAAQAQASGGMFVDMSQYIHAQIEYGRLLLQIVFVAAVAYFAIKAQSSNGSPRLSPTS